MDLKTFETMQNIKAALKLISDSWDILTTLWANDARARRFYYQECLRQGFSRREALELAMRFKPFGI